MKRFSRQVILILSACIIIRQFSSCCNDKGPVFSISDYGNSWITYAGNSVTFKDDSSNTASFKYPDADYYQLQGSHGEECGDYFTYTEASFSLTSQSNISNSLSFEFLLTSTASGPPEMFSIEFQGNSLYSFYFQSDSILDNPTSNLVIDEFAANGRKYYNVYEANVVQNSFSIITVCYLTREEGIVGFKTTDGKLWVLQ